MRTPTPVSTRRALWPAILIVLALTAACASGSDSSSEADNATQDTTPTSTTPPVSGGGIVWGLEAETDGLNPISGRFVTSGHIMASAIFDPLVTLDAEGEWQPYLAESLEPNDDFTEWTITLRENVTFHDGTPLDAEAVTSALLQHLDSAMTGDAVTDVSGVETVGPMSVKVSTTQSWAAFPYTLTTQVGYVPAPSMLDVPEDARAPVGTGPFKFQSWDFGTSFKASRNTEYWGTDENGVQLPYLDAIEFRPISDPQSRTDALVGGDIDALITVSAAQVRNLLDEPGINTETYSDGEKQFVLLNTSKPPFDNPTARTALAKATDTVAIRDIVGPDQAVANDNIWSPGELGYRADDTYVDYDPEAAKQLVTDYEAETGQPISFTYTVDDTSDIPSSQRLITMWQDAGIDVSLETISQADSPVRAALGNFQAIDWRFFGASDPDMEYVWLTSKSIDPSLISLNFAQFGNPEIDAALDTGRASTDESVREQAYADISRIINENVPYVWLYRVTSAIAANERVHGYEEAVQNGTIQTLGPKTWVARLWKEA